MTTFPDYDPANQGDTVTPPKRGKRVSKITGKPTGLQPETEFQISLITHYSKRCKLDRALREQTRLYAVNPCSGSIPGYLRDLQKRAGKLAGVWDLHFLDRRKGPLRYVWIEVKVGKNGLTDEQEDFERFLDGTPIDTRIVKTLDEFMKVIA